jgi:hypothetical protein
MDCPACFDELVPENTCTLGECGHSLCRPCAVAAVHVGMESGRPYPQCLVCVDEGSALTASESRYGKGWLSFEALQSLYQWCQVPGADLRGQQPVSALLVNRYCHAMLMAALNASPVTPGEAGLEGGRRPESRAIRLPRRRRNSRVRFGGGDDDVNDDSHGGGGVSESKSGRDDRSEWADSGPPPAAPPSLQRALSIAMRCPNDACAVVLKVGSGASLDGSSGSSRATCPYCGDGLCVLCGEAWDVADSGLTHAGHSCSAFADVVVSFVLIPFAGYVHACADLTPPHIFSARHVARRRSTLLSSRASAPKWQRLLASRAQLAGSSLLTTGDTAVTTCAKAKVWHHHGVAFAMRWSDLCQRVK